MSSNFKDLSNEYIGAKRYYLTLTGVIVLIGLPLLVASLAVSYAWLKPAKEVVLIRKEVEHQVVTNNVPVYRYLPKEVNDFPVVDETGNEQQLASKQTILEKNKWIKPSDMRDEVIHIKTNTGIYKVKYWYYHDNYVVFWEWRSARVHVTNNFEMIHEGM